MQQLIPINSFTDGSPSFPYQSSEASCHLGIPDSPAIHLAITQLAERLLALPTRTCESNGHIRIMALRCASYGVLMRHSFESVEFRFGVYLNLPNDQLAYDRAVKAAPTHWLNQAIERLEGEGIAVDRSVQRQATCYGWTQLP